MPDYGDGSPREGYGAVDPLAPSVANGQITPAEWDEYQRRRRRAAILGATTTIGGMLAAGPLLQAAGIGGAGGAAGAPEFAVSTAPFNGAVASGAPFAAAGGGAAIPTGSALSAATVGAGTSAAGGAGAGAAKGIIGGLTGRDLAALGLTGTSMIGSALSNQPNMNPTTATSDPNLMKLIQSMQGRIDKSEPLYDSILSMANGLLPTQYQKGGGGRM